MMVMHRAQAAPGRVGCSQGAWRCMRDSALLRCVRADVPRRVLCSLAGLQCLQPAVLRAAEPQLAQQLAGGRVTVQVRARLCATRARCWRQPPPHDATPASPA
jgi:hypothetical protein